MTKTTLKAIKKPGTLEAIIWLFALAFFAISTPHTEQHFSMCTFHWLGFTNCPGCGIGRSIGFFLHGDIATSWHMHMLGIPTTIFLAYRSITLLHKNYLIQFKNTAT